MNSQPHPKFIEENKDNWKKVRVFDSIIRPMTGSPAAESPLDRLSESDKMC
jgi:hypothetical protein